MLGGIILYALLSLSLYASPGGVCSCPCCVLSLLIQERGGTLAHKGKHHQSCFLLCCCCRNPSSKSLGKAAGLMDHGQRTLAALLLVAYNTARVCPSWAEASCPLQEGVSASPLTRGSWQCWSSVLRCRTLVLPGEDQPPRASTALSLSALTLGVLVKVVQIMEAKSSPSTFGAECSYYGNT